MYFCIHAIIEILSETEVSWWRFLQMTSFLLFCGLLMVGILSRNSPRVRDILSGKIVCWVSWVIVGTFVGTKHLSLIGNILAVKSNCT